MNDQQAFKELEESFIHSERGLELIRLIKSEFYAMKLREQKWTLAIEKAYSKPMTRIEEGELEKP